MKNNMNSTGNIDQQTLNKALYTASLDNNIIVGNRFNIKVVKFLINKGANLNTYNEHVKNQFNSKCESRL